MDQASSQLSVPLDESRVIADALRLILSDGRIHRLVVQRQGDRLLIREDKPPADEDDQMPFGFNPPDDGAGEEDVEKLPLVDNSQPTAGKPDDEVGVVRTQQFLDLSPEMVLGHLAALDLKAGTMRVAIMRGPARKPIERLVQFRDVDEVAKFVSVAYRGVLEMVLRPYEITQRNGKRKTRYIVDSMTHR